jgi:2-keto-4-pentenoate hydratase/2-oxohepta-3-ene-1,7-dioic acid hydratase in catechol pathway
MASWTYLVRFTAAEDGTPYYTTSNSTLPQVGAKVTSFKSISALNSEHATKSQSINTIKEILSPVAAENPIVCIGLNYSNHAHEAKLTVPKNPPMWYKPSQSLANPGIVPIPKVAQDNFLDFEGELTIVTSKDAKDISVEDAPSYILGYTVGNDLTARLFQAPTAGGGQYSYAKAFDKFAPMGPALINATAFVDIAKKRIKTSINGRVVQDSPLELIWGPAELVSFLSQGRTLPAGTAIMTGTPAGVGWFQEPQYSLKDGDVVEVSIEGIGLLSNTMRFE